jgi:small subunit ribosomal protein S20
MANTKSAAKRARQTIARTLNNRRVTTAVRTQLKVTRASIKAGAKDAARPLVQKLSSTLDKAAKTGRIHRNKANRLKHRTAKSLGRLAS